MELNHKLTKVEDGKDDIVISFDGEKPAITIHQEFLEQTGVPVADRAGLAQGIGLLFGGMIKDFENLLKV